MSVDYGYAWRNGPRWATWYLRQGKIAGFLRTLWHSLVRGHIGEACQECGSPYPLWHADDALYTRVTGNARHDNGEAASGLFCLNCFDRKAEARGISLQWNPSDVQELGMWDEVTCVRGASHE